MTSVEISAEKLLASLKGSVSGANHSREFLLKESATAVCRECTEFQNCDPAYPRVLNAKTVEVCGHLAGGRTNCDFIGLDLLPD